jgi:adenylate kinase family enzyme
MSAYQESTQPLIEFYGQRGLLISIPADGAPEAVFRRAVSALNGAAHVENAK